MEVHISTIDDCRSLSKSLKDNEFKFHVFRDPESVSLKKVVIRGLPIDTEAAEIRKELTDRGITVESVSQMSLFEINKKSESLCCLLL